MDLDDTAVPQAADPDATRPDGPAAPPQVVPLEPADPRQIGPYRLLGRLGAGGMGVVYLGRHTAGATAAVKVVREELAALPEFRARFAREVGAAAGVHGRHTAAVVGSDLHALQQWVASEYIAGPTLAEHLQSAGPLHPADLDRFAAGLAQAIAGIHAAGHVHRDLKPSNVILGPDGPKVIDFGIAHAIEATSLTRTGAYLGTLSWSSPEQIIGDPVTPATDLFAWGLVVAYAATGRHPYGEGRPEAIAYRIANQQPDLADLPARLRPAVAAVLQTDPARRTAPEETLAAAAVGRGRPRHLISPSMAGQQTIAAHRSPLQVKAHAAAAAGHQAEAREEAPTSPAPPAREDTRSSDAEAPATGTRRCAAAAQTARVPAAGAAHSNIQRRGEWIAPVVLLLALAGLVVVGVLGA